MAKTFGLALSGGGARGIAHAGVLKALDEMELRPSAFSGTSAGAIVGACYSAGMSPDDILKLLKESKLFSWQDLAWNSKSLFKGNQLETLLRKALPDQVFETLAIPLSVHATDFAGGQAVAFSSGDLIKPLMASSAIPGIFNAVEIEGVPYYDGGILDNFPAAGLLPYTSCIIGVHVNKMQYDQSQSSFKYTLERSFHMMIAPAVKEQEALCALVLEPELYAYGMFDTEKAAEIFDIGYRHAIEMEKAIKKVLG